MELYTMGEKVMSKNIVVVGGGSAGWLTALTAKKKYPDLNVIVIESKDIGILGAGEGSTPYMPAFLETLDISFEDLVKNCDATVKNGIKFTNWNNKDDFYYHGFSFTDSSLGTESLSSKFLSANPMLLSSIMLNNDVRDVDFTEMVSENNKVPFVIEKNKEGKTLSDYKRLGYTSFHFNATKLAARFREIGVERGIQVFENTITNVSLDKDNNVTSLQLDDNSKILCDFVFDCSGFHRLIIGKTFNSKWKSYKEFLPTDSAIPFFLDMTDKIPPYTEAIAMKYGWMWKIPLQNRFGCGYVYDSSLISEADAIKEVEDYLGFVPHYPRKDKGGFSFSPGAFEEPWQNNCVAVGLAANFVEPLEATSLWVSMVELTEIFASPDFLINNCPEIRAEFNKIVVNMNDDILNFIYFHYMSLRKDTPFWEKFSYENAPEDLKKKLDAWQKRMPGKTDNGNHWSSKSWFLVGSAQEKINKDLAKQYIEMSSEYKAGIDRYDYYKKYREYKVSECVDHRQFLEGLK
jgi:tryptophan halogenase